MKTHKEIISVDVNTLPEGWTSWTLEELKEYVKDYPKIFLK